MQDRNAEMVVNLTQDFTTRDEFAQSGARLSDAMKWLNRDAGGSMMFGFNGQGSQAMGEAAVTPMWTQNSIGYANYAAVPGRGGPYCIFDGPAAADYLDIPNAGAGSWQDPAGLSFLVWSWVDIDTVLAADMTVAAQYDGINECSWWLRLDSGNSVFQFICNGTGAVATDIVATSSVAVSTGEFYFVGAHYEPGASMTLGVAAASAHTLAGGIDTLTTAVPATLFYPVAGASDLTIGAISAGASNWWDGYIGATLGRVNVPVTNIASHMARLYGATYWLYGG